MEIEFLLNAVPSLGKHIPEGSLRVLEFYHATGGVPRINHEGRSVPSIDIHERVDDEIKRNFPKEYAEFAAYVEKNADSLYPVCRDNPGKELNVSVLMRSTKVVAEVKQQEEKIEAPIENLKRKKRIR